MRLLWLSLACAHALHEPLSDYLDHRWVAAQVGDDAVLIKVRDAATGAARGPLTALRHALVATAGPIDRAGEACASDGRKHRLLDMPDACAAPDDPTRTPWLRVGVAGADGRQGARVAAGASSTATWTSSSATTRASRRARRGRSASPSATSTAASTSAATRRTTSASCWAASASQRRRRRPGSASARARATAARGARRRRPRLHDARGGRRRRERRRARGPDGARASRTGRRRGGAGDAFAVPLGWDEAPEATSGFPDLDALRRVVAPFETRVGGSLDKPRKQKAIRGAVAAAARMAGDRPLHCETGFNAGYSASAALSAGADVMAFDVGHLAAVHLQEPRGAPRVREPAGARARCGPWSATSSSSTAATTSSPRTAACGCWRFARNATVIVDDVNADCETVHRPGLCDGPLLAWRAAAADGLLADGVCDDEGFCVATYAARDASMLASIAERRAVLDGLGFE
ncbi:hypothetical protein JL720_11994 [Aureococcus anophagefferens]|nr:hypothetical protein JL720_11994 [Aureococcus anophagefferens]